MRSSRHIFIAHLIRLNQIEKGTVENFGLTEEELEKDSEEAIFKLENEEQNVDEIDSQTLEFIQNLKDLDADGLKILQDMGIDLEKINS